jgi:SAM-dependent methyltransferase
MEMQQPAVLAPATEAGYFDALYAGSDDPWGLGDRHYERRKRSLLLASLPRERYRRAFEPGCATGQLTSGLLDRCDSIVAWDVSDAAVQQTRRRTGTAGPHRIVVEQGIVPGTWPGGTFDLLVISEVGYYCPDLDVLRQRIAASLTADGTVVACHWRHPAPDHPHTADEVHEALGAGLHRVLRHVEEDFLLDVWTRDGQSVARAEGIVP